MIPIWCSIIYILAVLMTTMLLHLARVSQEVLFIVLLPFGGMGLLDLVIKVRRFKKQFTQGIGCQTQKGESDV